MTTTPPETTAQLIGDIVSIYTEHGHGYIQPISRDERNLFFRGSDLAAGLTFGEHLRGLRVTYELGPRGRAVDIRSAD